ncbi:MAG: LemA family protein [Thermaceae bacterium]|nr:LemA family protein [Thermaceae bacterium]
MGWIVLLIVVLLGLGFVGFYNRIITLENRVGNALAQVDVQLKRRNDLIPNLVNTVKGYAAHEAGVFDRVNQARERVLSAGTVEEKSEASNALSQALRSVFALAEAYPQLKADANFRELQGQLEETENKIAYARQFFNDTVLEFNNAVSTVPGIFFAGPMGKRPKPFFQTDEAARQVPSVNF